MFLGVSRTENVREDADRSEGINDCVHYCCCCCHVGMHSCRSQRREGRMSTLLRWARQDSVRRNAFLGGHCLREFCLVERSRVRGK